MDEETLSALTAHLSSFITPERKERIEHVLSRRTRRITIILEDIFQPHNASAVIRSCDCFGIQDLHIIENRNRYTLNPDVELGAAQWITLQKWNQEKSNTQACIRHIKALGYTVYAATPHDPDLLIHEIMPREKTALLFGTEKEGLTDEALALADHKVAIPMQGFTESFNISVSAALCMYQLRSSLNSIGGWELTAAEKNELRLNWYRKSLKRAEDIEKEFMRRRTA